MGAARDAPYSSVVADALYLVTVRFANGSAVTSEARRPLQRACWVTGQDILDAYYVLEEGRDPTRARNGMRLFHHLLGLATTERVSDATPGPTT